MRKDMPPAPARPLSSLLCAVSAAAGALAMGTAALWLHRPAQTTPSSEALIASVLLGLAVLGGLLCLYLTIIWGLAAAVLLAGPASRTGRALLGPLRVLAPRLARRLTTGAAVATAATALTLTSSMAAQMPPPVDQGHEPAPLSQTTQLLPTDGPGTDPVPEAADGEPAQQRGPSALLPPLGWGEDPGPVAEASAGESRGTAPTAEPGADATDPDAVRIVVVEDGDSLWSISEDLLGPAESDPARIAAAWPLLHEANRDRIGADPDLLRPGQELIIPTALTHQDMP